MKVVTFENLKYLYDKMIDYIDQRIELHEEGRTNCPNCGAIIRDKTCPYCDTNLVKWYKR